MRGFYDGSLWESRKAEGDEAIKTLIREGVQYTSAVCVLVGTETWTRRWVKYEIARSVMDERGLLVVHINKSKSSPAAKAGRLRTQSSSLPWRMQVNKWTAPSLRKRICKHQWPDGAGSLAMALAMVCRLHPTGSTTATSQAAECQ
jgi:hypothetical protein